MSYVVGVLLAMLIGFILGMHTQAQKMPPARPSMTKCEICGAVLDIADQQNHVRWHYAE